MSAMYLAAAIAGLTVVTIMARGAFFILPASVVLPPRVEQALRFAPACALAAIIVPGVLAPQGAIEWSIVNPRLWAVVVAGVVFLRTRSMLWMLSVGMAVFTILRLATT